MLAQLSATQCVDMKGKPSMDNNLWIFRPITLPGLPSSGGAEATIHTSLSHCVSMITTKQTHYISLSPALP